MRVIAFILAPAVIRKIRQDRPRPEPRAQSPPPGWDRRLATQCPGGCAGADDGAARSRPQPTAGLRHPRIGVPRDRGIAGGANP